MKHSDDTIFGYIKREEANYQQPIDLGSNWSWNMKDHIELTDLYKNSQLKTGKDEFKPVKNITRPILNLQYRTEDIDVKDVQIYVDDPNQYHLSFLIKKYHDDVFIPSHDLDTFFDKLNESRIDYGAGLSKKVKGPAPECVPLQSIAFCDQTDILSGPIGLKHFYSPDQLLEKRDVGWGNPENGATLSVENLIILSREEKKEGKARKTKTPGKYIEIYEVHGNLPKRYFDPSDTSGEYETRMWIVGFYTPKNSKEEEGVILYSKLENESPFKLVQRGNGIYGRALDFGGAEELFEPQVWTNFSLMTMVDMLEATSKTILGATGDKSSTIAKRNNIKDLDNLEVLDLGNGDLKKVDTRSDSYQLFQNSLDIWEVHAQQMGAANDAIMGESPSSGTPFKLQELVTQNSQSLHDFRRGKFATHLEEIYRDWIIPEIQKEIVKGATFLTELDIDELGYVMDRLVDNEVQKREVDEIFFGKGYFVKGEREQISEQIRAAFKKKGSKHFIKILKDEFKNKPLKVKINILGKQKNLSMVTDKLVNVFRFAFSNPQGFKETMMIPGMGRAFNDILELSGMSPVDFSGITAQPTAQQAPQQGIPQEAVKGLAPQAQESPNQPITA